MVPESPYRKEIPYNKKADERAPTTRVFYAGFDRQPVLFEERRQHKERYGGEFKADIQRQQFIR